MICCNFLKSSPSDENLISCKFKNEETCWNENVKVLLIHWEGKKLMYPRIDDANGNFKPKAAG